MNILWISEIENELKKKKIEYVVDNDMILINRDSIINAYDPTNFPEDSYEILRKELNTQFFPTRFYYVGKTDNDLILDIVRK
jgi:hypothetical protein